MYCSTCVPSHIGHSPPISPCRYLKPSPAATGHRVVSFALPDQQRRAELTRRVLRGNAANREDVEQLMGRAQVVKPARLEALWTPLGAVKEGESVGAHGGRFAVDAGLTR